uniref:ULP_PROTEASE domain-containing protein n=1 Tax=Haemonchus contortus TaxID=6289 RepID=A0A7I4YX77_HAECO
MADCQSATKLAICDFADINEVGNKKGKMKALAEQLKRATRRTSRRRKKGDTTKNNGLPQNTEKAPQHNKTPAQVQGPKVQNDSEPRTRTTPRSTSGKELDIHQLVSSKSSHNDEWIIGGTSNKQGLATSGKSDGRPVDHNELLSSRSSHQSEWIIGGTSKQQEAQITKQNSSVNSDRTSAGTEQTNPNELQSGKLTTAKNSEWILGTGHVADARSQTPERSSAAPTEQMATAKSDGEMSTARGSPYQENLSREVFGYDDVPPPTEPEILPTTAESDIMLSARGVHSRTWLTKSRGFSTQHQLAEEKGLAHTPPSALDAKGHRHRKPRRGRSGVALGTSSDSRSLMRFRSYRIRERRKKRLRPLDLSLKVRPTEEKMAADCTANLTPLKAPISIDSTRQLTRNGDQINLRQVLRIYGSGIVEEPYAYLPRVTSLRSTRGMVTVKYGTNMIEIAMQNTDITPSKRGRVGSWIFTPSQSLYTVPVVFGKTKITNEKGPAPYCVSIASPFWVSCHQEQYASSKTGERIRESIEVRQFKGSETPYYAMVALNTTAHPLFSEYVYLGKGVIRIDRSCYIPTENKWRNFFDAGVTTKTMRQYRIPLPWRGGVSNTNIPRAPPITDIQTTVRSTAKEQKDEKESKKTEEKSLSKAAKKKKKGRGRRRLPPPRLERTGFNISSGEQGYDLASRSSTTFASLSQNPTSESDLSQLKNRGYRTDLPNPMENAFLPPKSRMKESKTLAGSGVLASPTEASPQPRRHHEEIYAHKESELDRDKIAMRKSDILPSPRKSDRLPSSRKKVKEPPMLRAINKSDPNPATEKRESSGKDVVRSYFDYRSNEDGIDDTDEITIETFPAVFLRRQPVDKSRSTSSKRKARSSNDKVENAPARSRFIIHKEAKDAIIVECHKSVIDHKNDAEKTDANSKSQP